MKFAAFLFVTLYAAVSLADTWGEIRDEGYYFPKDTSALQYRTNYKITDAKELVVKEFTVSYDDDGTCYNNYDEVVASMRQSVATIGKDLSGVVEGVVANSYNISVLDAEFKLLVEDVNARFAAAYASLTELKKTYDEPQADGGVKESSTADSEPIVIEKTEVRVVHGGVRSLPVDGKSMTVIDENTSDAAYAIKGFNNLLMVNHGMMPFYQWGSGQKPTLGWQNLWDNFDEDTLQVDTQSGRPANAVNDPNINKHGVHLAGWYSPTAGDHRCDETVADHLLGKKGDNHYVVTRYDNGNKLHYMRIGTLGVPPPDKQSIVTNEVGHVGEYAIKGFHAATTHNGYVPTKSGNTIEWKAMAGAALKVIGTDNNAAVIGTASTTNVITFASETDSRITVKAEETGDNSMKITLGVYWK